MKKLITCFYLMGTLVISAQTLSNPGFENWSVSSTYAVDTVPNQWWTMYCSTVHQTTDSYQGVYATRLQGYFSCGIAQGILVNGQRPGGYGDIINSGTPFTAKPGSISGFYKYTGVTTGDSAEVTVILKKYDSSTLMHDTVAIGSLVLAPAAGYTAFTVMIGDKMPGISPDSIIIMFNSSKYNLFDGTTMALPSLYIDRIALPQGSTGIIENNELLRSIVYPDPFTNAATLELNNAVSVDDPLMIQLFDENGKCVKTIASIKEQKVLINRDGLSAGTYFYSVTGSDRVLSKGKMMIR